VFRVELLLAGVLSSVIVGLLANSVNGTIFGADLWGVTMALASEVSRAQTPTGLGTARQWKRRALVGLVTCSVIAGTGFLVSAAVDKGRLSVGIAYVGSVAAISAGVIGVGMWELPWSDSRGGVARRK
jgi:hypothetical protein